MADYYAGSGGGSWNFTDPHNDLTHQWMMEANAFNAEQAQITRDWQEKMSNTAYQRAMADMAKAGLNPILAGSLGGASTPGGATATANFTGAGATSSGGSSYWSRSIQDNLWNMGMDALNSAGREALGSDLAGIIRQAGSYIGKLMGNFENNATMVYQNSASGMKRGSGTFAKHNLVSTPNVWNNVNNPMAYNGYGNNGMSEDDYMHYVKRHNQYRYATGRAGENEFKYQKKRTNKLGTK